MCPNKLNFCHSFWYMQTWPSPLVMIDSYLKAADNLPSHFACTTNSLLMCTTQLQSGWVWTLAKSIILQHKTTRAPRHTHRHPAEIFTWTKCRWTTSDCRLSNSPLWIINDALRAKRISKVPQVDNFLSSTHTNRGHIWGNTWKQLVYTTLSHTHNIKRFKQQDRWGWVIPK